MRYNINFCNVAREAFLLTAVSGNDLPFRNNAQSGLTSHKLVRHKLLRWEPPMLPSKQTKNAPI